MLSAADVIASAMKYGNRAKGLAMGAVRQGGRLNTQIRAGAFAAKGYATAGAGYAALGAGMGLRGAGRGVARLGRGLSQNPHLGRQMMLGAGLGAGLNVGRGVWSARAQGQGYGPGRFAKDALLGAGMGAGAGAGMSAWRRGGMIPGAAAQRAATAAQFEAQRAQYRADLGRLRRLNVSGNFRGLNQVSR